MTEDELYESFVESYLAGGDRRVPEDFTPGLRKRCLFFVKMMGAGPGLHAAGSSPVPPPLPPEEDGPRPGEAGEGRYIVEEEIARGGMGRVLLAYDRDFRRRVAMKVMLGNGGNPAGASRFIQEAQTTAQLEHPNIGPVYDIGLQDGDSPFFTMKWIRGRSLAELLASGSPDMTLTRLIQILQQAAMAVHFANSKGVIHRDLKPHNIMIGDFGEVLVVDWGLAKVGSARDAAGAAREPDISTSRADGEERTLDGSVQGSLAYMAPEQARGEVSEIDARTDVFGLGAVLYEVLTGLPPYTASSPRALLALARRGDVTAPSGRAPGRAIPGVLEETCRKALSARKEDRHRDAGEFHRALQDYLEGIHSAERQAAEASRLIWVAEKLLDELRAAERREVDLRSEEGSLRAAFRSFDPEEKKKPVWEITARREEAADRAAHEWTRTTAAYLAVLSVSPGHSRARQRLAELFYGRFTAAEERGDRESAALYRSMVAQYQDGQYSQELSGEGMLHLRTDPAGATVLLGRFEERGPILTETPPETLGTTPIEKSLPPGSYLAILWKEGFSEVRYPFVIERRKTHLARVRLMPEGRIPAAFVQVPGGPSILGTSWPELHGLARRRADVAEVFVGRFPVTFGEYCEFLNDRFGGLPAPPAEYQSCFGREEYIVRGEAGFQPIRPLDPRMAVNAVTWAAAAAYAAWLGVKLGKKVRLLREEEWERCARGADGRVFPWGNGFDWAFTKGALSRPGEPFPEPVGAFPRDISVFGIRDLAGTVRELCDGWAGEGYRPCRGGSWYNPFPFVFRADFRTMQRDGNRFTDVGFRVCYDEP